MISLIVATMALSGSVQTKDFRSWAPTPPMGWNSWDCFGTSVTEEQFKANATVMARELKASGYTIATVDIQWYEPDAKGFEYRPNANVVMDGYGRLLPAPNRFPSAATGGFKSLAAWTHKQGLKFGIHLMRGIPRRAVDQNLPIFGTKFHAQDIADKKAICPWNPDMYGVDMSKPGAQEYYNSVFKLIASWGVDFVKVDDLSRPYAEHKPEIEAIRRAIDASGRKMLLSMSPGETPVAEVAHATGHANMWRISDDFWDSWPALLEQFKRLKLWNDERLFHRVGGAIRQQGAWPDADMLPLGWLAHGTRKTNFTIDEQRTLMTLWGIARSPLIIGADLSRADDQLLDLLRQPDVVRMNQKGSVPAEEGIDRGFVVWTTSINGTQDRYTAIFNVSDPFTTTEEMRLGAKKRVSRASPVVEFDEKLTNVQRLALQTTDAGDGIMFDHSVWVNPRFVMQDGSEVDITSLPCLHSSVGYGKASTQVDPEGNPLIIKSMPGAKLLSVHAPSNYVIEVPKGAVRFRATGTLSDKAVAEKVGGTVEFGVSRIPVTAPGQKGLRVPDMVKAMERRYGEWTPIWPQEGDIIPWHGCQLYRWKSK
jgi:hypothetical protein